MTYGFFALSLYRYTFDHYQGKSKAAKALIDAAIEGRKVQVPLPKGIPDRSWFDHITCPTAVHWDKALAFRAKAKEAGMGLSELARSCVEPVA